MLGKIVVGFTLERCVLIGILTGRGSIRTALEGPTAAASSTMATTANMNVPFLRDVVQGVEQDPTNSGEHKYAMFVMLSPENKAPNGAG